MIAASVNNIPDSYLSKTFLFDIMINLVQIGYTKLEEFSRSSRLKKSLKRIYRTKREQVIFQTHSVQLNKNGMPKKEIIHEYAHIRS